MTAAGEILIKNKKTTDAQHTNSGGQVCFPVKGGSVQPVRPRVHESASKRASKRY